MRVVYLTLVYFACSLCCNFAQTQIAVTLSKNSDLKESATRVPRSLARDFAGSIGELNLHQLIGEIEGLSWYVNSSLSFAAGHRYRTGAVNFVEEKAVIVNQITLEQAQSYLSSHDIDLFLLHEGFGGVGVIDDHYERTMALYLMGKSEADARMKRNVVNRYLRDIPLRTSNYVDEGSGGSGTSVGGGGDLNSFLLKRQAIDRILASKSTRAQKQILVNVIASRVEPLIDRDDGRMHFFDSNENTFYVSPLYIFLQSHLEVKNHVLNEFIQWARSL